MFSDLPRVFGDYIVLDEIGVGGMAKVYRAKPIAARLNNLVAIKRLRTNAAGNAPFNDMFIDEARIAAQLLHPNIVQTYELGRDGDCLFMVMEHVWGKTSAMLLRAVRESGESLPVEIACAIVLRAAEGLDFAHRAIGLNGAPLNVVHRDVTPQNILISYDGEVKLIDFGVAKADVRLHKTAPGMIKGKLRYLSPEQVAGQPVDARADIYGLGLTLYELLAGHEAFDDTSPAAIFDKILRCTPDALSEEVPRFLREFVARALAKHPRDRLQSVAEFADALAPFAVSHGSVVGTKDIAALLRQYFVAERAQVNDKVRAYSKVRLIDCVNINAPRGEAGAASRSVDTAPTVIVSSCEAPTTVLRPPEEKPPRHPPTPTRTATLEIFPAHERRGSTSSMGLLLVFALISALFWSFMVASLYLPSPPWLRGSQRHHIIMPMR